MLSPMPPEIHDVVVIGLAEIKPDGRVRRAFQPPALRAGLPILDWRQIKQGHLKMF